MVALPIDDGLQPTQQGFPEIRQELHQIFQTLLRSFKNSARTKVFNLGQ
jgi:hypothetical protein